MTVSIELRKPSTDPALVILAWILLFQRGCSCASTHALGPPFLSHRHLLERSGKKVLKMVKSPVSLKTSVLIFVPYMWLVAYWFFVPSAVVIEGMGMDPSREHPAPYRLNGLKELLLCICIYMPAYYYDMWEAMAMTGFGRVSVLLWLVLLIQVFKAPWGCLQGGLIDLPCGILTIVAYYASSGSKTYESRKGRSYPLPWTRNLVRLSGYLEGAYGVVLMVAPELIDGTFFNLSYSTLDSIQGSGVDHLALRSYGICTFVIGIFYIGWSIPVYMIQHMYLFIGAFHILLFIGQSLMGIKGIVPQDCLESERYFHLSAGFLIFLTLTLETRALKHMGAKLVFNQGFLMLDSDAKKMR